jgi:hypothetical protein
MARLGIRSGIRCLSSFLFSSSFPFFFFLLFSPFFFGLDQHFSFLPPQKNFVPAKKKKNGPEKKFTNRFFISNKPKKTRQKGHNFFQKPLFFHIKCPEAYPFFCAPFGSNRVPGGSRCVPERVQMRSREVPDAFPGGSRRGPGEVQPASRRSPFSLL